MPTMETTANSNPTQAAEEIKVLANDAFKGILFLFLYFLVLDFLSLCVCVSARLDFEVTEINYILVRGTHFVQFTN